MSSAPLARDRFRAFPRLAERAAMEPAHALRALGRSRARSDRRFTALLDPARPLERLALALCAARAVPLKELLESFEVFVRVRARLRAVEVVDLYCGHGLLGALFAAFEPGVERVLLVDRRRPASHDRVRAALASAAPWALAKLEWSVRRLASGGTPELGLTEGAAVVGVHACGPRTDRCLDAALAARGPVAVLPCCHPERGCPAPPALRRALGLATAWEVHRTYRLEAAGWRVRWDELPSAITDAPRLLVAEPPTRPRGPG